MAHPTIAVDPTLFPEIDAFYQEERGDVLEIENYVRSNCTLDSAFGLLLTSFKPGYDHARDEAFSAMSAIGDTLKQLGVNSLSYAKDVESTETALQDQVASMHAQILALQQQVTDLSKTPQGGGFSGGGGGGGGGGSIPPITTPNPPVQPLEPGGSTTPPTDPGTPPTQPPAPPAPPTTPPGGITINVGSNDTGNVTVIVGNNDSVGTTPVDPTPGLPSDASSAADPGNTLIDQFWQDKAAHDPLGRSAEQLEEAWISRESIQFDGSASGLTTLTPGDGGMTAMPAFFSFDPGTLSPGILTPGILTPDSVGAGAAGSAAAAVTL